MTDRRTIAAAPPALAGWVVSPAFDLFFLANLAWPLLLLPGVVSRTDTAVDFWQVYFLTLPHRWLTLGLVLLDRDRREGISTRLIVVALAALGLIGGVWAVTGSLTCLAVVDYCWNAWHFGAQHAGVLRMYSRKVGGAPDWLERWGMRLFVTYGVLRTAGWATGWLEAGNMPLLRAIDFTMLILPAALVISALLHLTHARIGKFLYLLSICTLYTGVILSLSFRRVGLILALVTATSLVHAIEYLAVVTHYAWRRRTVGSAGPFRAMAKVWVPLLATYAVLIGVAGVLLERKESGLASLWIAANLWAALIHYAFDGMIWKLRRPATARALGV